LFVHSSSPLRHNSPLFRDAALLPLTPECSGVVLDFWGPRTPPAARGGRELRAQLVNDELGTQLATALGLERLQRDSVPAVSRGTDAPWPLRPGHTLTEDMAIRLLPAQGRTADQVHAHPQNGDTNPSIPEPRAAALSHQAPRHSLSTLLGMSQRALRQQSPMLHPVLLAPRMRSQSAATPLSALSARPALSRVRPPSAARHLGSPSFTHLGMSQRTLEAVPGAAPSPPCPKVRQSLLRALTGKP